MSELNTWSSINGFTKALNEYSEAISSSFNTSKSSEGLRTIRPEFNRKDYDAFRPNSAVPQDKRKSISLCNKAYKQNGIIKQVIDLMSDFACQGVRLVHKNKSAQTFFEQWFDKVGGKERSERFLNNLYRLGNVFLYRAYTDVSPNMINFMKSVASDIKIPDYEVDKSRIPFRYTFFNPLSIDINEKGQYVVNISNTGKFFHNQNVYQIENLNHIPKPVFDNLPKTLRQQITNNEKNIVLEQERLSIYHYKKDDWEDWADPMIYPILDDIFMLERMRLADFAALDGAISNIRLWRLGSLEHKILPNKPAIDRLRQILSSNQGGGTMELVWGPELDFKESATDVHKFLGSAKYDAPLNAIYAGVGIPPSMTGQASSGKSGFTNNSMSLKTLIDRLEYGRMLLIDFWSKEIEMVRQAMGFRYPAEIMFDQMSISDENAEKALLIQLADRNIISDEMVIERFKGSPEIERARLKKETEDRESGDLPTKASPFHNANFDMDMEKLDKQIKSTEKISKEKMVQKPAGPNGRPIKKKDTAPRKQRVAKPRTSATIKWVNNTWDRVSELINAAFLNEVGKKHLRQLSKAEIKDLEYIKIDTICGLEPLSVVEDKDIIFSLSKLSKAPQDLLDSLEKQGITLERIGLEDFRLEFICNYSEYILLDI